MSHFLSKYVAEVICRKDNSKLLKKTIKDELTKGLETISKETLKIYINKEGEVDCMFVRPTNASDPQTDPDPSKETLLSPNVYITGDLAFYAIVLGREGMSGQHCLLCQLLASEYKDLTVSGKP